MSSAKDKSSKKRMSWISGNQWDCRKAFQSICDKAHNPNIQVLICGNNSDNSSYHFTSGGDVILALKVKDLFDTRPRILKVVGVPNGYIEIANYLDYVNDKNILVFYGATTYHKPGSKQSTSVKVSSLYKKIKEEGWIFEFPTEGTFDEAAQRVIDIADEYKKQIDREAASRVVSLKGRNLDLLESETIKLCDYQDGKKISLDDVNECCNPNFLDDIWSYITLLDKQDSEGAMVFLQHSYREASRLPPSSFYGEFMGLLYNLSMHYRFLMTVKDLCGDNPSYSKIKEHLSTIRKINPTDAKELAKLSKAASKDGSNDVEKKAYTSFVEGLSLSFSPQFISMNFKKNEIMSILKRPKKFFYDIWLDLKRCELQMRQHSGNPTMIQLCMNTFTMVACGKMTPADAALARGML